jgi:uncharacterized protein (UPF0548 family)
VDLTYPQVGASRREDLPPGYRHLRRRVRLGTGPAVFEAASRALATWQMHRAAGIRVRADAESVAVGGRFASGIGIGRLRLWAPCEVVWVVDEPRRYGYGYGTLPGHPETGEEALVVTVEPPDSGVWFDIRAFSRLAYWYLRPGRPLAEFIQDRVTDRYVEALRRLASR